MNRIHLPRLFFVGLLFMLTACQAAGRPLNSGMFGPGDTIGGMSLTTGSVDVPPLWAFCSPGQHSGKTTTSNCSVPVLPSLAIGHLFMVSNDTLSDLDWSQLSWQLSIDDQLLDLEAFGTIEYVMPVMSKGHWPAVEVFQTFTAWDVVLMNLTPGVHTLSAVAQTETDSYSWVVNLNIEANDSAEGIRWAGIQKVS